MDKQYVEAAVNAIKASVPSAVRQAREIAANRDLTVEAKAKKIAEVKQNAIKLVEYDAEREFAALEQRRAALEQKALLRFSPSADEVGQLTYTRTVLLDKVGAMTREELAQLWRDAITLKDKITLRVIMDSMEAIMSRRPFRNGRTPGDPRLVFADYDALIRATEEVLYSPEQRQARAELAGYENAKLQLTMARTGALAEINGIAFDGKTLKTLRDSFADQLRAAW